MNIAGIANRSSSACQSRSRISHSFRTRWTSCRMSVAQLAPGQVQEQFLEVAPAVLDPGELDPLRLAQRREAAEALGRATLEAQAAAVELDLGQRRERRAL